MDLFSTMRVFRRQWQVLAPMLLLAVLAELVLPSRVPPSYRSTTQVLLVPTASDAPAVEGYNPFLNFSQSLITFAGIVARSAGSPEAVRRMEREGATASFKIDPPAIDWNPGPIVSIAVESTDPRAVRQTSKVVVADVLRTLKQQQQQAGAPSTTVIRGVVVSQDATPLAVYATRQRAAVALGVLALVLMTATAFLAESLQERRTRRALLPLAPSSFGRPMVSEGIGRFQGGAHSP